jgi:broad specificity phosphatase PhoE
VLLLVRHGETEPNRHGLFLGRLDPPLTDLGHQQARALAEVLPAPTLVISSPLQRARDTASAFGQPVQVDERWTELDYGRLDGHAPSDVPDAVWERWRSDVNFGPHGAETLAALGARVRAACDAVAAAARVSTVVVVTHVSPIKAALAWALQVPDTIAWRMYVEDAAVSRIDLDDGEPVVRWFNRDPAQAR